MPSQTYPRVVFEETYGERQRLEMTDSGYCNGAVVESEDGNRYPVFFVHPIRIQQELDASGEHSNVHWFAEPGLIVVDEVSLDVMQEAVSSLWKEGFFTYLKPL